MSDRHTDINDDEIRIISSDSGTRQRKRGRPRWLWPAVACALCLIAALVVIAVSDIEDEEEEIATIIDKPAAADSEPVVQDPPAAAEGYVIRQDTVAGGVTLCIQTPANAVPTLEIGQKVLDDTTIVLATQAADIRRDNGDIVGACVIRGELLSKGEAKAGFCSIINGKITVGVADATPMFEEAMMNDGYFFRQYPLVVGGQIVENKPKGKAIRKALAELNGTPCVITSAGRLTFHDFSSALTELGVRNAVYLVGANSSGVSRDADGRRIITGNTAAPLPEKVNFIVWR